MKLRRMHIQNFRSIVDSGVVDIEESVTVVIGKNEQGKTNVLKALASFNKDYQYKPSDLPKHLRPKLEDKDPSQIPIVTLWLAIEQEDLPDPQDKSPDVTPAAELRITKHFDNHYEFRVGSGNDEKPLQFATPDIGPQQAELETILDDLREKIDAHAQRLPAFKDATANAATLIADFAAANFADATRLDNLFETFAAALKGLPSQDKAIQDDFAAEAARLDTIRIAMAAALAEDLLARFWTRVPRFLLHQAGVDRVPDSVSVAMFLADPNKTSRGMGNLCKVAGLSVQKIQELSSSAEVSRRETYEDHYRSSISGAINEFWTQEEYTVAFRIERETLTVSISDGTYAIRVPPSERSDGFQWYLSFYSALIAETATARPTILLLDNPGLELHADGQRDIKRFLEEKYSTSTQVIYVTHSPAMVDVFSLQQIRKVERVGDNVGTKVGKLHLSGPPAADLLEPVRSAIGASLVTSLIANDFNILVEGAADKPILEGAFKLLHEERSGKIAINGSIAETGAFLPGFYERSGLPFVVYLDADSRGRELGEQLKREGVKPEKIVGLGAIANVPQGEDCELEDVLTAEFYHQAVLEAYPGQQAIEKPPVSRGKRTKAYEEQFKKQRRCGFSKRRVADKVKKLLLEKKVDEKSREELVRVTKGILDALERQAGGAPGGQADSTMSPGR